jgi:hypothetical protein
VSTGAHARASVTAEFGPELLALQQRLDNVFITRLGGLTFQTFLPTTTERLEFLGDSVLGNVQGLLLEEAQPAARVTSRVRANLVSRRRCSNRAAPGLAQPFAWVKAKKTLSGHKRPVHLNALEAVIVRCIWMPALRRPLR